MAEGTIQGIEQKPTKTGKTMYNVLVDGVKYGCFEDPGAKIGDHVTFDASKSADGKFNNAKNFRGGSLLPNGAMTSANPVLPSAWAVNAAPKSGGNGHADPEREGRIVRQNATSSAAHLIGALVQTQPGVWDIEMIKKATVELSKFLFEVNFTGYDAGTPF